MLEYEVGRKLNDGSSEALSEGNQTKFIQDGYIYKIDQLGYEGLAEAIVSELEGYISGISFLDYTTCYIKVGGKRYTGCMSKYIENLVDVTLYDLLKVEYSHEQIRSKMGKGLASVEFVENFVNTKCGVDIHEYLGTLIKLDALVLNNDRHIGNIGFNIDGSMLKPSVFYDFGGSLLLDIQEFPIYESLERNLRKVRSKPFSKSFKKQVGYFSDVKPFKINIKKFFNSINGLDIKKLDDNMVVYYNRAIKIIKSSLCEKEGLIWTDISM